MGEKSGLIEGRPDNDIDFELPTSPQETRTLIDSSDYGLHHGVSAEKAKEIIAQVSNKPEYRAYRNQKITMDTLRSLVVDFERQNNDFETNPKKAQTHQDLIDLLDAIEDNIKNYFGLLIQIDNISQICQHDKKDEREVAEDQASLDKSRKIMHDTLLSNLRAFCRLARKSIKSDIAMGINPEKKLFRPEELEDSNRHAIGIWAYDTFAGSNLERIIDEANEIINKKER